MFALPTALILTLPLAAGMPTFELPFATGPIKLPTLTLPVAVIAVILALVAPILPTLALPVTFNVPATLTPVEVATILAVALPATKTETLAFAVIVTFELPLASVPTKLAATRLPVKLPVPATLTPVPVTTTMFAFPIALIVTLPFAAGMLTFELPFAIVGPGNGITPVSKLPLPEKKLATARLPRLALPELRFAVILALAVTLRLPVMFAFAPTVNRLLAEILLAFKFAVMFALAVTLRLPAMFAFAPTVNRLPMAPLLEVMLPGVLRLILALT